MNINTPTIYKITNPAGAVYIGQSWYLTKRKSAYKNLNCKGQKRLYYSLLKYRWENHIFEVVQILPKEISQEILDNYEIFYWRQYKEAGYNLLNIKEPGKGGKHSEETKEKIRLNKIGTINSDETRRKISESNKGRKLSKETKNKMSLYGKTKILPFNLDTERKRLNTIKLNKKQLEPFSLEERRNIHSKKRLEALDSHKKEVLQYDLKENFIKEWSSITDVFRKLSINNRHISEVCLGKRKSSGGFKWKYKYV